MESLDLFLGTRAKCRETAKSPLSEVAIDILDHHTESYLILHDYYSTFLAVEKINSSKNDIVIEGQEITDLLYKYFLDIFDIKAQCLLSDNGQNRYTCFITRFCSENDIKHYFPKRDELPGISKITKQIIFLEKKQMIKLKKNLLNCCFNFTNYFQLMLVQLMLNSSRKHIYLVNLMVVLMWSV